MFQVAMVSLLQVFSHIAPTLNVFTHAKLLHACLTLCSSMDHSPQAFLSTGFSRQEYWSGLSCPPPGVLPDPGIKTAFLTSPALAVRFFTTNITWEAPHNDYFQANTKKKDYIMSSQISSVN